MKKNLESVPDLEREREELLESMRTNIPRKLRKKIEHVVKVSQSSQLSAKFNSNTHGASDADTS